MNRLPCAAQVAQRYRRKTKETGKKQNTVNGKRKASIILLSLFLPDHRSTFAASRQPPAHSFQSQPHLCQYWTSTRLCMYR